MLEQSITSSSIHHTLHALEGAGTKIHEAVILNSRLCYLKSTHVASELFVPSLPFLSPSLSLLPSSF